MRHAECVRCGYDVGLGEGQQDYRGRLMHRPPCPAWGGIEAPVLRAESVKFTLALRPFCRAFRHVECSGIQHGDAERSFVCTCTCHKE